MYGSVRSVPLPAATRQTPLMTPQQSFCCCYGTPSRLLPVNPGTCAWTYKLFIWILICMYVSISPNGRCCYALADRQTDRQRDWQAVRHILPHHSRSNLYLVYKRGTTVSHTEVGSMPCLVTCQAANGGQRKIKWLMKSSKTILNMSIKVIITVWHYNTSTCAWGLVCMYICLLIM